ncbi:MAG: hypothetical protein RLZZ385_1841 [Pseudomonadota bacterium]|jgi:hypothetical protein
MPNIVKGSKQEQMVVVPYRPYRRWLTYGVLTLLLVSGGAGGFLFGHQNAQGGGISDQTERQLMSRELNSLREENTELRRQVALLDRTSVMDKKANEEIQLNVKTLRERIAQLEQDVLFYRQVMSEDADTSGLLIGQMDIEATGVANRYRYKLVMRQQEADGDTFLEGHVNVNLVGVRDEEQVVIPLRDISQAEEQLDIRLRFKYFQNIEGELELPEGFTPEQIHIAAVSTAPSAKTINKNFSWVVEGD